MSFLEGGHNSDVNYSQNVFSNNRDIGINSKPVFYKMFFDRGIIFLNDLQFVDNVRLYDSIKQKGPVTNFLTWTALRSMRSVYHKDEFKTSW